MVLAHPVLLSCVQFDAAIRDGSMPLTDVAPIAKRLGLAGVEYREVYWHDKAKELPAVRTQMVKLGLRPTYCTFTPLFNTDPAAQAQLLADIDDAANLGSRLLRVFVGVKNRPATEAEAPAVWAATRAALARAEHHRIHLAVENHANVLGPRWTDVLDALTVLDHPTLGVNIDTANYVHNGEPLMTAIEELSPHIIYSHLKDIRKESDGSWSVLPIGQGDLDFGAILAAYARTGSNFPVCFEFGGGTDPEAAIASSLQHLRSLGLGAR